MTQDIHLMPAVMSITVLPFFVADVKCGLCQINKKQSKFYR